MSTKLTSLASRRPAWHRVGISQPSHRLWSTVNYRKQQHTSQTQEQASDVLSPARDSNNTSRIRTIPISRKTLKKTNRSTNPPLVRPSVNLSVDDKPFQFSPILLRDLCQCSSCVDPSTKQKLFSTADIPAKIEARTVVQRDGRATILWSQDVPGYDRGHTTELGNGVLKQLTGEVSAASSFELGPQELWDAENFSKFSDTEYEAYMEDDPSLFGALRQLHTHGLLFLSNVPESENSVSTIAERIGPVKNTFYGYTWDVRSVPEAKNVAYTSQDLGFHMDLLYMQQPPHLQFLHCIRSSSSGGASLFTDSYKSASDLFRQDSEAFHNLERHHATFHYNHPSSHLYRQHRPVFEMKPMTVNGKTLTSAQGFERAYKDARSLREGESLQPFNIADWIDAVSWSPPFQGPFALQHAPPGGSGRKDVIPVEYLSNKINWWNAAAQKFSSLIHRPEMIYERLMRPGECVIFDNRRVLHARRAFDVGDIGKERWLRGAYLDKDPYLSRVQVLQKRFGGSQTEHEDQEQSVDRYFETA